MCQPIRTTRRYQEPGDSVLDQLATPAYSGRHGRTTGGEPLDERAWDAFAVAGQDHRVAAGHQTLHLRLGDHAHEGHATCEWVARSAIPDHLLDTIAVREQFGAGDREMHIRHRGEGVEQVEDALLLDQPPDEQQPEGT
ncbi:hypothetical protein GCM10009872_37490 [Actinopolymorpha rutila]